MQMGLIILCLKLKAHSLAFTSLIVTLFYAADVNVCVWAALYCVPVFLSNFHSVPHPKALFFIFFPLHLSTLFLLFSIQLGINALLIIFCST